MLFTLVFASEILHWQQVSNVLAVITRFIPQIIAALLILVLGMLLARFVQTLVLQALSHVDVGYKKTVGKVVYFFILIFVFVAASQQLGFDLSFVTTNMLIVFFTFLIIFGVGLIVASRSLLENILSCQELRSHLKKGDIVEIAGVKGAVKEITLTGVILEHDGKITVLPARLFFTQTYTLS